MAENSNIDWTKHTANLWWGCTKVHEGCDHCYAEALSHRWGEDVWGNDKPRRLVKSIWKDLARFQRLAAEAKTFDRVFVGSMMDIAEKPMPVIDSKGNYLKWGEGSKQRDMNTGDLRNVFFDQWVPACPDLDFLLLTKRPRNYNKYIPHHWKAHPPVNIMYGTSVVNQKTANQLVPQLLEVNGMRFLSIEPQLDTITLNKSWLEGIHWIICGGESGAKKRPFNPDWARKLRDQCAEAGIPFFMKQIDKIQPIPQDLMIRQFPEPINY
jgi:protein gp37